MVINDALIVQVFQKEGLKFISVKVFDQGLGDILWLDFVDSHGLEVGKKVNINVKRLSSWGKNGKHGLNIRGELIDG